MNDTVRQQQADIVLDELVSFHRQQRTSKSPQETANIRSCIRDSIRRYLLVVMPDWDIVPGQMAVGPSEHDDALPPRPQPRNRSKTCG